MVRGCTITELSILMNRNSYVPALLALNSYALVLMPALSVQGPSAVCPYAFMETVLPSRVSRNSSNASHPLLKGHDTVSDITWLVLPAAAPSTLVMSHCFRFLLSLSFLQDKVSKTANMINTVRILHSLNDDRLVAISVAFHAF